MSEKYIVLRKTTISFKHQADMVALPQKSNLHWLIAGEFQTFVLNPGIPDFKAHAHCTITRWLWTRETKVILLWIKTEAFTY